MWIKPRPEGGGKQRLTRQLCFGLAVNFQRGMISTMTPPPRHWRFQIHLSTAVVMMFVAGGIIWANVTGEMAYGTGNYSFCWTSYDYGFPFCAVSEQIVQNGPAKLEPFTNVSYTPHFTMAFIDLVISLLFAMSVWFVCEWLIRRRAPSAFNSISRRPF